MTDELVFLFFRLFLLAGIICGTLIMIVGTYKVIERLNAPRPAPRGSGNE